MGKYFLLITRKIYFATSSKTLPSKIIHESIRLIFILLQYKRISISYSVFIIPGKFQEIISCLRGSKFPKGSLKQCIHNEM